MVDNEIVSHPIILRKFYICISRRLIWNRLVWAMLVWSNLYAFVLYYFLYLFRSFCYLCWHCLCSLLLLQLWLYFQTVKSVLIEATWGTGVGYLIEKLFYHLPLVLLPISHVFYFLPQWWADDFPFSLDRLNPGDTRFPVKPFWNGGFSLKWTFKNILSVQFRFFINGEQDPILDFILHWRACVCYKACSSITVMFYFIYDSNTRSSIKY